MKISSDGKFGLVANKSGFIKKISHYDIRGAVDVVELGDRFYYRHKRHRLYVCSITGRILHLSDLFAKW